jgi:hypothetical protein
MTWAAILLFIALAVLWLEDKTPQEALFSIARETLKGFRRIGIPLYALELSVMAKELAWHGSFPYKKRRSDAAHLPVILNIPTSEGSGEATHPDAVHIPGGWGAGRWTWLMSATPYPSGGDFYENPELYVSYDGIRWTVPAKGVNPLAKVPVETARRDLKKEYHSDASLLLHGGKLRVYYRWSGVALDRSVENRLYAIESPDGLAWNDRTLIFGEKGSASKNRNFLSPSVMFMDGKFIMWTVEQEDACRVIVRRSSDDGLNWSVPERTSLKADYDVLQPWHLDVIRCEETGGTVLLLTVAENRGYRSELHYGFGDREGRVWKLTGKLIEPGYSFEGGRIYRSSLAFREKGLYALYYSALGDDGKWSVARMDIRLDAQKKVFEYDN